MEYVSMTWEEIVIKLEVVMKLYMKAMYDKTLVLSQQAIDGMKNSMSQFLKDFYLQTSKREIDKLVMDEMRQQKKEKLLHEA